MVAWLQIRTGRLLTGLAFGLALHVCPSVIVFAMPGAANEQPVGAGMVREFAATAEEVHQAVLDEVKDQIIHGTKIFDKEPVRTGAEAVNSTPLFDPWTGPGTAYFKIRKNAIAPRHFLESADQGTIALRFVVIPVNQNRTRVRIDAVYVESSHHAVHISDGTVSPS